MAKKNNTRERMNVWFLDYLVDGKSRAEEIFRQRKLKRRISGRNGIKGYPNRRLVSITFWEEDDDLFESCLKQLWEEAPQEVREDGLTVERVLHENLVMPSWVTR